MCGATPHTQGGDPSSMADAADDEKMTTEKVEPFWFSMTLVDQPGARSPPRSRPARWYRSLTNHVPGPFTHIPACCCSRRGGRIRVLRLLLDRADPGLRPPAARHRRRIVSVRCRHPFFHRRPTGTVMCQQAFWRFVAGALALVRPRAQGKRRLPAPPWPPLTCPCFPQREHRRGGRKPLHVQGRAPR